MLLINGRSCVNLLLASRLHQANLSYKIIATKNCSPPPPLFVALNHASLALLPEEITGSTFNSMWVWCHQQPNAEFILRSYELGLKNLGQVISLQKIYQHLEHNVPQDHVGKKTSEINMFTTQHANPSRTIARSVGIAKQLLIKLDGFDGAFQIFAWPHILGFLPIDGHGNYACIFASQNSESIPWDSPEEILATLNNFTKTKGIIVRDCHEISEPFILKSAHHHSYLDRSALLLGEAVHLIHPLAGQGMNLSLGDVRALTDILKKSPLLSAAELAKEIEKSRFALTMLMVKFCEQLSQSHAAYWAPLSFKLFNNSLFLKEKLYPFYGGWEIDNNKSCLKL